VSLFICDQSEQKEVDQNISKYFG